MSEISVKCAGQLQWDLMTSATSFSQVLGVVAAVVFGATTVLLTNPRDPDLNGHKKHATTALLLVFMALIAASYQYAVISGEQNCPRAFAENVLAGAVSGIAGVLATLSVYWLLYAYGIYEEPDWWLRSFFVGIIIVILASIIVTIGDAQWAVTGKHWTETGWEWLLWVVPFVTISLAMPLFLAIFWATLGRLSRPSPKFLASCTLGISLVVILLASLGFAWVSDMPTAPSPDSIRVAVIVALVLVFVFSTMNMIYLGRSTDDGTANGEQSAAKT